MDVPSEVRVIAGGSSHRPRTRRSAFASEVGTALVALGQPSGFVGPCRAVACAAGAVHRASSQLAWEFAASLLAFVHCWLGLQGFRRSVAPCGHSNEQPERPSWSCLHLQSALWRPGLATPQVRLSWDSSGVPCVRLTRPCPLPSRVAATLRPTGFPPDGAFRSRGFSPPQRFAPSAELWACCIPVPDRVRVVSASVRAPRSDPEGQSCVVRCRASPTRRSHPSKKSPLSQPFRVTAAVALLALRLPVNRAETRLAERPSPSGRCSAPGSVVPSAVSGGRHPLLPWAWFPFRALKPTPRCRVARPPSRPVSACSTTQPPPERPNRFPDSAALVIPGALPPIAASCHARRAPVCPAVSVPPRLTAPPDESGCAVRGGRTLLGFVTSKNELTVCRALRPVRRTHSISRSVHRLPECRDGPMQEPCQLFPNG